MLLPPRFSRVVLSWLMGVSLTAAATNGCNVGFGSADSVSGSGGAYPAQEGDAGSFDGSDFKVDGGTGLTPSLGSPLCNLTRFPACMPDNATVDPCVTTRTPPAGDGGTLSDGGVADSGSHDLACHVRASASDGGTTIGPTCLPAGRKVDGEGCLRATDCAASYECVGSPGVCRHYCCDGRCGDPREFCDIETDVDSLKVPVCALVHPCKPLTMDCPTGETCSIVTDDGTTSCVPQGPAKVAESCEETNCGLDLTCLGAFGSRKCFKLCDPTHPCSAQGDKCISAPATLFKQVGLGVCQNY